MVTGSRLISSTRFGQARLDESSSRMNNAGIAEGQLVAHLDMVASLPLVSLYRRVEDQEHAAT